MKLKEKLQHYRVRDQFKQADGPMTAARDISVTQTYPERPNNFGSPEIAWYRNNCQRFPSFVSTAYDFNTPATQINPVPYNSNPYFQGSHNSFLCMQTQLKQTPFSHPGETGSNNSPTTSTWHESNQPPRNEDKEGYLQGLDLLSSAVSIESRDTIKQ